MRRSTLCLLSTVSIICSVCAAVPQTTSRDVIFSGQLVYAQDPLFDPACSNLLPTVGDLNGDGLPDLAFLPIRSNTLTVMKSVGRWAWDEPEVVFDFGPGASVNDVTLVDIDFDGDEDVVYFVQSGSSVFVGTLLAEDGILVPAIPAQLVGATSGTGFLCDSLPDRLEVSDITGDGALDVVVGASEILLVIGVGDGTFGEVESVGEERASSLAAVDRVPGNRMEILSGRGDEIAVYEYVYPDESPTSLPACCPIDPIQIDEPGPEPRWRLVEHIDLPYPFDDEVNLLETVDLNDDGSPDLVCVSKESNTVLPILHDPVLGDVFAPMIESAGPSTLATGDFDGDGQTDLIVCHGREDTVFHYEGPRALRYAHGLGNGTFESSLMRWAAPLRADRLVARDLDLDGDPDLLIGEGRGVVCLENRAGMGESPIVGRRFAENESAAYQDFGATRLVTGDFNNDSRADVALISLYGETRVSTQQPDGSFVTGDLIDLEGNGPRPVAVDIDGDGNLDMAVGFGEGPQIMYGNGDSTFEPPVSIPPPDGAGFNGHRLTLAIGHFNEDTLLDLVTSDEQTTYLFQQEPQTRAFEPAVVVGPGSCLITVADMDADGNDDVIAAYGGDSFGCPDDTGAGSWIALMDGQGGVREIRSSDHMGPLDSVAVGDENGDGHLDVLGGLYGHDWYRVAHGNGDGGFFGWAEVQIPVNDPNDTAGHWANRIEITDLNGDGAADVCVLSNKNLFHGYYPDSESVFIVLGAPQSPTRVVTVVSVPLDVEQLRDFALTDLDGDGAPEIITAATEAVLNTDSSWPRFFPGFCITPGLVRPIDRCPADLAEPFGLLDLADILAFGTAMSNGNIAADPAPPFGVFDLADIVTFVETFLAGCP